MRIPKTVILATSSVLFISLLAAWIDLNPDKRQMGEYLDHVITDSPNNEYKFDNPAKAYQLLEQLDVLSVVPEGFTKGANFSSISGGFKLNENYCSEHRAYFVNNPDVVFKGNNFITNFIKSHKLRSQVIPMIGGVDLHPKYIIKNGTEPGKEFINDMSVEANIFLTQNIFFKKRQVGKQFSCLSQASNHIPGHNLIYRKDKVAQALVDYARAYESRPQCFSFDRYFPKTWVLQEKDQCLDFFREFNSKKYQKLKKERNVVYFRKIGADVHEGKGVFPVNDEEEIYIQELYKNGTLCKNQR